MHRQHDPNSADLINCALISPNNKSTSGGRSCGVAKLKEKLASNNNNNNNSPLQLQTVVQVDSPATSSTHSQKSYQFCRICHDGMEKSFVFTPPNDFLFGC